MGKILTQADVDRLTFGEKRIIWDRDGLGVRVTPKSVVWLVDYQLDGKRVRKVIGPAIGQDAMLLVEARLEAAKRRAGKIPEKEREEAASRGWTYRACWETLIATSRLNLSPATIDSYEKRGKSLLESLGERPVGAITEDEVRRAIFSYSGERNRTYAHTLCRMTINWAIKNRKLPANHFNPATAVTKREMTDKNKVTPEREITDGDLSAFGKALSDFERRGKVSVWLAGLIRLSLLCALRPGEARTLLWEDVAAPAGHIIVRGKNGARKVYLSKEAASVLATVPRVAGNPYVFVGQKEGQPITSVYKMLNLVQEAAGIAKFRPYDLRHTAATGALVGGSDIRAVQDLLGHADIATTQRYLHASEERKRAVSAVAGRRGAVVLNFPVRD